MSDANDTDIVVSGYALSRVSQWLGESAEAILQTTDATAEEMFEKPRPQLLGLGAKYLSHKSMEKSGLEMKLKHRLKQSVETTGDGAPAYQPAQLNRHHQHHRKRKHGEQSSAQVQQTAAAQQDSDEEEGKLKHLKQPSSETGQQPGQKQVFDRRQLLLVPAENLSKWQRKRLHQKAKKQQQQ